jgi:hypothetical protein
MGSMINPAEHRFVGGYSPASQQQVLMIADYVWWTNNETAILEWMDTNLPRGRNHQTGMVVSFDNDQDLMMFMLRWA